MPRGEVEIKLYSLFNLGAGCDGQRGVDAPAALPPWKNRYLVQEAGWAPGPVWTGAEILPDTCIRSPDRPVRSTAVSWILNTERPVFRQSDFRAACGMKSRRSRLIGCPFSVIACLLTPCSLRVLRSPSKRKERLLWWNDRNIMPELFFQSRILVNLTEANFFSSHFSQKVVVWHGITKFVVIGPYLTGNILGSTPIICTVLVSALSMVPHISVLTFRFNSACCLHCFLIKSNTNGISKATFNSRYNLRLRTFPVLSKSCLQSM
jgi:hypothetical protein